MINVCYPFMVQEISEHKSSPNIVGSGHYFHLHNQSQQQ